MEAIFFIGGDVIILFFVLAFLVIFGSADIIVNSILGNNVVMIIMFISFIVAELIINLVAFRHVYKKQKIGILFVFSSIILDFFKDVALIIIFFCYLENYDFNVPALL